MEYETCVQESKLCYDKAILKLRDDSFLFQINYQDKSDDIIFLFRLSQDIEHLQLIIIKRLSCTIYSYEISIKRILSFKLFNGYEDSSEVIKFIEDIFNRKSFDILYDPLNDFFSVTFKLEIIDVINLKFSLHENFNQVITKQVIKHLFELASQHNSEIYNCKTCNKSCMTLNDKIASMHVVPNIYLKKAEEEAEILYFRGELNSKSSCINENQLNELNQEYDEELESANIENECRQGINCYDHRKASGKKAVGKLSFAKSNYKKHKKTYNCTYIVKEESLLISGAEKIMNKNKQTDENEFYSNRKLSIFPAANFFIKSNRRNNGSTEFQRNLDIYEDYTENIGKVF